MIPVLQKDVQESRAPEDGGGVVRNLRQRPTGRCPSAWREAGRVSGGRKENRAGWAHLPPALFFQGDVESVVADLGVGEGEKGPADEPLSVPGDDIDAVVGEIGGLGTADDLFDCEFVFGGRGGKGTVDLAHGQFVPDLVNHHFARRPIELSLDEPVADRSGCLNGLALPVVFGMGLSPLLLELEPSLDAPDRLVGAERAVAEGRKVGGGGVKKEEKATERGLTSAKVFRKPANRYSRFYDAVDSEGPIRVWELIPVMLELLDGLVK